MNRRTDQLLAGLVVVLAVALVWVVAGTLHEPLVKVGDSVPNFKVVTEAGKAVSPSDFGGKVLIVNFWASWCPPCIKEAPSMNAFAKQFGPQGVVLVAISIDRNEQLYRKFLKNMNVAFDTSRDPEANISTSFGTFQIPETYVIDRSGKVVEKIISDQDWMDPQFIAHIQKLL